MYSIFIIFSFIFIIGLCVGSFLNVVILRAFSNESIVLPPSKCPLCSTKLKWYHNIPLFSYLFLKGKCAYCKKKISIQYPIVELITGILFLVTFAKFGLNFTKLIFIWYFISIFIVLAVCDIKEKVIFDFHTFFLIAGGLIFNFLNIGSFYIGEKTFTILNFTFSLQNSFIAAILGLILGILVMESLARIGYLFARTRAFGEGDSYIAAALGAILGWKLLILALFYSIIIQIVFTFPVYIKKLFVNKDYRTFFSISFFVILAILSQFTTNYYVYSCILILLLFSGIYTCKRIISGLRNNSQDFTYLPFGPAMVIAALIILFKF